MRWNHPSLSRLGPALVRVLLLNKTGTEGRKDKEKWRKREKRVFVLFYLSRNCFFVVNWPCVMSSLKSTRLAIFLKTDIEALRTEFVQQAERLAMWIQFFLLQETSYFARKVLRKMHKVHWDYREQSTIP